MSAWGHTDFLRKSEIGKYIMDDILLIQCSLTVIKFKAEAKMCAPVQLPPLDENLGNLLEVTEGADVYF